MNNGWIKIHRKILDWEWFEDLNTFRLFFFLLMKANHKKKHYKGVIINEGEIMTGYQLLSSQTGLSVRQVRTCISRLKSTHEITVISSSKGTIIQLVKWSDYQILSEERQTNDKQTTNKRQTNDKQTTTNKNVKNVKNEEEEEVKKNNSATNFKTDSFYDIKKLAIPYLENKMVINAVLENKKNYFKNLEHLKNQLRVFIKYRISEGEIIKTPSDFASHFRRWNIQQYKFKTTQTDLNGMNASDRIKTG